MKLYYQILGTFLAASMLCASDDEDFIQALLDQGYIELAQQYRKDHPRQGNSEFKEKILDAKFLEAQIKAGVSDAQEKLDQLYNSLANDVTQHNLDFDRLNLKFDYGKRLIEKGKLNEGLKHLNFFTRYCPQFLAKLPSSPQKQQLNFKFYDSDLHIGKTYLKLMKIEEDKEKKIELADQALEKLEDYIWALGKKNAHIAVQGYKPLIEVTQFLHTEELAELDDLIDQFTEENYKENDETWYPLWLIEANPSSIVDIFDTVQLILTTIEDAGDRLRRASKYKKNLEKLKLDPEPTFYMDDHHNLMMAQYCLFLATEADLGKRGNKFKKEGKKYAQKISLDPTKSPYAKQAANISQELGLKVELASSATSIFNDALKFYSQGQFADGRRAFESFLWWFKHDNKKLGHIWFRIGQGYFQENRLLEATYAFEKSWDVANHWYEDEKTNAKVALRYMNSSAINHNKKLKEKYPNLNEAALRANRDFMQSIRQKMFTEIPKRPDGIGARFFWALSMYRSRDIENNYQLAFDAFDQIPDSSKYYGESLFYKFQCSFKQYQNEDNSDLRHVLFDKASKNSQELFDLTATLKPNKKEDQSLLKLDAAARTTIIQLYLLQDDHAAQAKDLLENFEQKYKQWIDESVLKRIPAWKIEARYLLGTKEDLNEAMDLWRNWQKEILSQSEKPSDLLIKTTQDLANNGIKKWMSENSGDSSFGQFQKHNSEISSWITNHVKITPLLLVQLAAIENNARQWRNVIDYCERFIEKYESDTSWKRDPDAKKYINNIYRWQVESYQNLKTEENFLKAVECWKKYYERTPHSSYIRNQADCYQKAGDLTSGARAKEHYAAATTRYSNLRRKSKAYRTGTEKYWESYDLTLQCREKMGEYETCARILINLRFDVADSDQKRQWLLNWVDQIYDSVSDEMKNSLTQLKENVEKDRLQLENDDGSLDLHDESPQEDSSEENNPTKTSEVGG